MPMERKTVLYCAILIGVIACVLLLIIVSMRMEHEREINDLQSIIIRMESSMDDIARAIEDRELRIISVDDTNRIILSDMAILQNEHDAAIMRIRQLEAYSQYSPKNRIGDDSISVHNDRVVISVNNPYTSTFSNTNSMLPLLSETSRAIQVSPDSHDDLFVGDVISYALNGRVVIHRIVELGYDDAGWYAITKGDNNVLSDPQKVRFSQVRRVLVAVIY
jgi:hypothetical protein